MKIIGTDALYFNQNFQALTQLIFLYNAERHATARGVEVVVDHSHPAVSIALVLAWVAAGGEVEDLPCFFEMTPTAYAKAVPVGIPNRTYQDENDIELIYKWNEWHDATHEHSEIAGKHYVPSNSFDKLLTGSELAIVAALSGVKILTSAEYVAKLPVAEGI